MAKKDQELEKVEGGASLEELQKYSGMGTDGLGSEDVRPPRLIVATSMHPHVKRGDPKHIDGLKEMDIFNDLTQEIYGEGPLQVIIVKFLSKRWVEFDGDGNVVDANVPNDDPRTQWTKDEDGRAHRGATLFYDYLLWLPEKQEMVAFSLKGQQANKVGVPLNSLLKHPINVGGRLELRPPAFARTFQMVSAMEKNDRGSWAVANIKPLRATDSENLAICAELYKSFSNKNVVIEREREPGDGDNIE